MKVERGKWVPEQRTAPTPRRVEYKIHIERHD